MNETSTASASTFASKPGAAAPQMVWTEADLHFQVSKFLVYEAQLLDEHRFSDWLALFDEQTSYKMPVHRNTLRRRRDAGRPVHAEIEMAHYDDDRPLLQMRVTQLESGQNWAEEPRSLSRHFITNVRAEAPDQPDGLYRVRSNFLVTRSRGETEQDQWAGEREDRLKYDQAGFKIVSRLITLDQNVILSKNLSIFF